MDFPNYYIRRGQDYRTKNPAILEIDVAVATQAFDLIRSRSRGTIEYIAIDASWHDTSSKNQGARTDSNDPDWHITVQPFTKRDVEHDFRIHIYDDGSISYFGPYRDAQRNDTFVKYQGPLARQMKAQGLDPGNGHNISRAKAMQAQQAQAQAPLLNPSITAGMPWAQSSSRGYATLTLPKKKAKKNLPPARPPPPPQLPKSNTIQAGRVPPQMRTPGPPIGYAPVRADSMPPYEPRKKGGICVVM